MKLDILYYYTIKAHRNQKKKRKQRQSPYLEMNHHLDGFKVEQWPLNKRVEIGAQLEQGLAVNVLTFENDAFVKGNARVNTAKAGYYASGAIWAAFPTLFLR